MSDAVRKEDHQEIFEDHAAWQSIAKARVLKQQLLRKLGRHKS